MTEKRFQRIYGHKEIVCKDNQKKGKEKFFNKSRKDYNKFVDLLNELNDENEQLKEQNENYKMALEQCGVNVKILDGDVE